MNAAADTLNAAGDLKPFLSGYRAILQEDVDSRAFDYSEEYHRDRLLVILLENQAIKTAAEYEVTKVSRRIAKFLNNRTEADCGAGNWS